MSRRPARKAMLDAVLDAAYSLRGRDLPAVVTVSVVQMCDLRADLADHRAIIIDRPWGLTFSGIDVVVVDLLHVAEPDGTVREVLWPADWRRA